MFRCISGPLAGRSIELDTGSSLVFELNGQRGRYSADQDLGRYLSTCTWIPL